MGKTFVKFYKGDMVNYEIYSLVDYYDPILRTPTIPYDFSRPDASKDADYIMHSMTETLTKLGGLGLSANQVGLSHRICTINLGTEMWTLFNPEISFKSIETSPYKEGCLSYQGLYLKINRPAHIKVKFQAINGEFVEKEFDGLTATVLQHELDHLDGILFTNRVSSVILDREKKHVKKNLKKMKLMSEGYYDDPKTPEKSGSSIIRVK